MNSQDFHEGMVYNMEWQTKKQAQLDALYERERAKYSTPSVQQQQTVTKIVQQEVSNNNNNQEINKRFDRLERRIDKLYEMFGNAQMNNISTFAQDQLFVFAPQANIQANQAIMLTDQQLEMLINRLMND